jgi:NAD(P)-dependent dehydrogenase (short-subunit alcohol dehydrogenase family)
MNTNFNKLPKFDFTNTHVLITGASSGIGHYFACLFHYFGAHITLVARREHALETLRNDLSKTSKAGQKICILPCDISKEEQVENMFSDAVSNDNHIDVIINNAGIAFELDSSFSDFSDWRKVMDINLNGTALLSRIASQYWVKNKTPGNIINITSIAGIDVAGGALAYSTSKAAVIHLTKSMALELARHNIRVNALAPGYIKTDLNSDFFDSKHGEALIKRIPQRRLGSYSDLAGPIMLLASESSTYITGSVFAIDGGHLCRTL